MFPRPGLLSQILKTLRFTLVDNNFTWVNKIGLRNPGILYGLENYNHNKDVLSIAIMNKDEIDVFNRIIPNETNIEINVSCPNINKQMIHDGIHVFLNPKRKWCIVKLSPICDTDLIDNYYSQGFRQFHCSNTLPVENGGASGKVLIPYTSKHIQYIQSKYKDACIIAGGGIYDYNTLMQYKHLGASHFSLSTIFFHPIYATSFLIQYYKNN